MLQRRQNMLRSIENMLRSMACDTQCART